MRKSVSKCSPSGELKGSGERASVVKNLHYTCKAHMRKTERLTIGPHPSECWRLLKKYACQETKLYLRHKKRP